MLEQSALADALSVVVETSPCGIAIVDADGVLLHVNPAMARLLGTPLSELPGQDLARFVHPADRAADQSPYDDAPDPRGRRVRRRVARPDGSEVVVTALVTPVGEGTGSGRSLSVVQVLPEREEAQELDAQPLRVPLRVVQARAVEQAATTLGGAVTVAQVTAVMEQQLEAFEASGLLISLATGPRLRLVSARGYPEDVLALLSDQPMSERSPMVEAVHEGSAVFVETLREYVERYPDRKHVAQRSGKLAWAFMPMIAGGEVIGSWCLSFDGPRRFTVSERALLTTLSGLLAQAVARCEALEAERSLTRTLQRSLLPQALPEVPGCAIEVRYQASVAGLLVGGDFYDVVPLPGGGTGIVIGDAQGHSAAAAALMGQVRAALRAYAAEGHDPATIAARASRFLVTAGVDSFVTCTYAALDATHDGLTIVRAGHPEPVLVTPDGAVEYLSVAGGLPLGIDAQAGYPVTWVPLTAGCRLVLYTDGLVERRGVDPDVGEDRLLRRIAQVQRLPLKEFADALLSSSTGGEDDVAVLVLERGQDSADAERRQVTYTATSTDLHTVRTVRRRVAARCREWGWGARLDDVELLVSELVTNAVRHVGGTVSVTVTTSEQELLVAVTDTSVVEPRAAGVDDAWETSGRGLTIVAELADAWGVDPSGPGKTVWFSLGSRA